MSGFLEGRIPVEVIIPSPGPDGTLEQYALKYVRNAGKCSGRYDRIETERREVIMWKNAKTNMYLGRCADGPWWFSPTRSTDRGILYLLDDLLTKGKLWFSTYEKKSTQCLTLWREVQVEIRVEFSVASSLIFELQNAKGVLATHVERGDLRPASFEQMLASLLEERTLLKQSVGDLQSSKDTLASQLEQSQNLAASLVQRLEAAETQIAKQNFMLLRPLEAKAYWEHAHRVMSDYACSLDAKLRSSAERFTYVSGKYPGAIKYLDLVIEQHLELDTLLATDESDQLATAIAAAHTDSHSWAPAVVSECQNALTPATSTCLGSLHVDMIKLVDVQPQLLGDTWNSELCSQLVSLMEAESSKFEYENSIVERVLKEFIVDMAEMINKGSEEHAICLQDMDSQEEALIAKITQASKDLSSDMFLPDVVSLEKQRMQCVLALLKLFQAKYEVGTSRSDALTSLLCSKLTAFEAYHEGVQVEYVRLISHESSRLADATQKLQALKKYLVDIQSGCEETRLALQEDEHAYEDIKNWGCCSDTIAAMIAIEKKRLELRWKDAYHAEITKLAAQCTTQLQEQEQESIALELRWSAGKQFVDSFSSWLRHLYRAIDVRAENVVMLCRQQVPLIAAKCNRLQRVALSDVRRRQHLTTEAVLSTRRQVSQLSAELLRLQRSRVNVVEFSQMNSKREKLLIDLKTQEEQLSGLQVEEESLQSWTPVQVLTLVAGFDGDVTAIDGHVPCDWLAKVFFTRSPFDDIHLSLNPGSPVHGNDVCYAAKASSHGSTILSKTLLDSQSIVRNIAEQCEWPDMENSSVIDSEGGTGHLSVAMSAPVEEYMDRCFLPTSEILTLDGPTPVSKLTIGTQLVTLSSCSVAVKRLGLCPERDQDITTVSSGASFAQVSSSHAVAVGLDGKPMAAKELRSTCPVCVASEQDGSLAITCADADIQHETITTKLVEVELTNPNEAILLCMQSNVAKKSYMLVFGAPTQQTLFAVVGAPGKCISVIDKDPRWDESSSCHSDPLHKMFSPTRVIRTIRPAHDCTCKAICRFHFAGNCRSGALCTCCHHPSHYEGRDSAPTHRSSRKKNQQGSRSRSTG